jgi:hypothetical protein
MGASFPYREDEMAKTALVAKSFASVPQYSERIRRVKAFGELFCCRGK